MMSITALIIDDERTARMELRRMLADYPAIKVVGEASNADEAGELIRTVKPDVIFLDIQMPGRSGFELLESLISVPIVIFVTAFDAYAVKAFEVSALDYLMKPVREERFAKAVEQAIARFKDKETPFIFVKDRGHYHMIKWEDVHLIESMDNYARLFFSTQSILLKTSLNQLEEQLDRQFFFRTSRAQIINLSYVESIREQDGRFSVHLKTGQLINFSSRQSSRFKSMNRY
jgi:two-component system, LytTR family, response regulator